MLQRKLTYLIGTSQEFKTYISNVTYHLFQMAFFVCATVLFEQIALKYLNFIYRFEDEYFNDRRYDLPTNFSSSNILDIMRLYILLEIYCYNINDSKLLYLKWVWAKAYCQKALLLHDFPLALKTNKPNLTTVYIVSLGPPW